MEIINNFMTVKDILPADKTVSVVTIGYKTRGEIHAGHNYILNMAKEKSDLLMVNFCEQQASGPWFDHDFEYREFDQEYCVDWCRRNLVDYVLIFSCDSIVSCKQQYDITSIKTQADSIFTSENYSRFKLMPTLVESIKFVIGTFLLMQTENKLYNQNYRIRSWNDGIYSFIVKDFSKKYYKDFDLVDPVRDENGLIISSSLLGKPQEMKDGMIFVRDQVEEEFTKGNRDMRAMQASISAKILEQNLPVRLTSIKYYQEAITNNKILTTFGIHSLLDGKTYFLHEYFYYF